MNTYEPGDVAMVSALNRPTPYRAYYDGLTWREYGHNAFCVDTPATIRPLVVLDLDPALVGEAPFARRTEARLLTDFLRETADDFLTEDAAKLARKVADQIEAQTKPPRIPEPGLWAVVEAWRSDQTRADACTWVKRRGLNPWRCDCGKKADWSDLVDPTIVRNGIEDES